MKFDQDLCLNLQYDFGKMNSTLGSVVPLAMFLLLIWRRKTFGSVDSDLTLSHSQMHLSQLVARKGKSNVRKRSLMKRTLRREGFTVFLALF